MAVIETKFSVGDRVWHASTTTEQRQHPCPDCKDTREWKAIAPSGDEFTFRCPRCAARYRSNNDLSLTYTAATPTATQYTIGSVRHDSAGHCGIGGPRTEYMCRETGVGSGSIYKEADLFHTKEDALRVAAAKANAINADQSGWIAKSYNRTLELSDYQLVSGTLRLAEEERRAAGRLLWNINDLFDTIREADDKDAILDAIEEYRGWQLSRDRDALIASGIEAPSGGETTEIGSTEGESPTGEAGDAQNQDPSPFKSEGN